MNFSCFPYISYMLEFVAMPIFFNCRHHSKVFINEKRARIEIQPRFKIQYPMKNQVQARLMNLYEQYLLLGIWDILLL